MAQPNFFIVGAPKCGTTALYEYLRPHPNVFMSPVKEPHFFARDLGGYPMVKTSGAYAQLFADCGPAHLRRGEASVYYLYSSVAAANIRNRYPDAKLVAMLRNPVDMVYSLHSQLRYVAEESEPDFEIAWRLQGRRRRGLDMPRTCREPFLVQYEALGSLGTQVERLLSVFPRSQVKLVVYDDFAASPERVYGDVLDFLELPHDRRIDFSRINDNKRARYDWLKMFMLKPPPVLRQGFRKLKQWLGPERLVAFKERLTSLNTIQERRPPLSAAFRAELAQAFRSEVALLSRLLDRDLGHWSAEAHAGTAAGAERQRPAVAPLHAVLEPPLRR